MPVVHRVFELCVSPVLPLLDEELVVQFEQCQVVLFVAISPRAPVFVQTGILASPFNSVTLMGLARVPSIRSLQLFAIIVPFMRTYGPLKWVKREAADWVLLLIQAFHVPPKLAPLARCWHFKSAPDKPPKLPLYL